MPIEDTILIVQNIGGEIGKENIKNYYYDTCAFLSYREVNHRQYSPPSLSNPNHIVNQLIRYICIDDFARFENLLNNIFICKVLRYEIYNKFTYAVCRTRPCVEALYYIKPQAFLLLINALLEKNDNRYYESFIDSMECTNLNADSLFSCTAEMKFEAYEAIFSLKTYAKEIGAEKDKIAIEKSNKLSQINTEKITQCVISLDTKHTDNQSKFRNLKFKCEVLKELLDCNLVDTLAVHRGRYKRIITNIITILFLGAIPNIINCIATCGKDFLFFKQTTSEKSVVDLTHAIGLDDGMLPNQLKKMVYK